MIGISKLYCGSVEPSDVIRYGRNSKKLPNNLLQFSIDKKPVIVWNITKSCNLRCYHCYANATNIPSNNELSTSEGKKLITNLAKYGIPVLIISGGEPLLRKDLVNLADHAISKGIRVVISSNGTLINTKKAKEFKKIGLSYIGISLDGGPLIHDKFRSVKGSFNQAIIGIRNCQNVGLKVGLRFTILKRNITEISTIFNLLEKENIPRLCFYHLVYSGRGNQLINEALDHTSTRALIDLIIDHTKKLFDKNKRPEILTVANHADGPYIYLRLLKENPIQANIALTLLKWNKGNNSGIGIGSINWDGNIYPDQFWRRLSLGNIHEHSFSELWNGTISHPILTKLRKKHLYLEGRCTYCCWLNICGGNSRIRAESATGNLWSNDPACYLTDNEIKKI